MEVKGIEPRYVHGLVRCFDKQIQNIERLTIEMIRNDMKEIERVYGKSLA